MPLGDSHKIELTNEVESINSEISTYDDAQIRTAARNIATRIFNNTELNNYFREQFNKRKGVPQVLHELGYPIKTTTPQGKRLEKILSEQIHGIVRQASSARRAGSNLTTQACKTLQPELVVLIAKREALRMPDKSGQYNEKAKAAVAIRFDNLFKNAETAKPEILSSAARALMHSVYLQKNTVTGDSKYDARMTKSCVLAEFANLAAQSEYKDCSKSELLAVAMKNVATNSNKDFSEVRKLVCEGFGTPRTLKVLGMTKSEVSGITSVIANNVDHRIARLPDPANVEHKNR